MNEGRPELPAPEDDLGNNTAGASLRQKSSELRDAHPFLTLFLRAAGSHSDERAWRKGAEGEEAVGQQLRKLNQSWCVLHGIPVGDGDSDIDHIVIGPGGVFTLNTKNHLNSKVKVAEKAIYVNGKYRPYIRNARFEGSRASKILTASCGFEVCARPLVVVIAENLKTDGKPPDVTILKRREVVPWLKRQPVVLTAGQIEGIYARARRRETWTSSPKSQGAN